MADNFPSFYRGNTVYWTCYFTDDDGDAIDITGATVSFIMKSNYTDDDADALISKTATLTDPTAGECQFLLTSTNTDITAGEYYGEYQYVSSGGDVTTLQNGMIKVLRKVFE